MGAEHLLAIDNGTQSLRALLFDRQGNLVAKQQYRFEPPYHSPEPGAAEQEVSRYWDALVHCCQGLWREGADPASVAALSLTSQRTSVVALDKQGTSLGPAVLWLDQRRATELPLLPQPWRILLALPKIGPLLTKVRQRAPANRLAQQVPEQWRRCDKLVSLSAYLTGRLIGTLCDSTAAQVGYLPFDYRRHRWHHRRNWRWAALGVTPEQMCPLKAPGERLGRLTAEAASELGLAAELPLFAAGGDKTCEVLGSGGHQEGVASLSFGTTATVNLAARRYREVVPLIPAYPACEPGVFLNEKMLFRGFWMVSWFKEQFGQLEQLLARESGEPVEALFDQLVTEVPPGAMGLMLQPYWGADLASPEAKGSIIGFGDVHTRAHLYRALIEGLAYGLKEGLDSIERATGARTQVLRISGGGSQSCAAMQLTADLFGLPAERPHTFETSGLGAAICAAVGLGWYPDFAQAQQAMVRVGQRFEPNPQHHALYQALYQRVYRRLYPQLAPLYREIRRLTGYPAG
ncbi:FGGY-family carbohydrate kinase [Ferrimonas balearica]|uniref:FGGY-family carbohydrate kinase n=1 Tax=Ferrimonas balearica TaxID=44012 RepID=UPI001C994A6F|nr:FGGY-family carbohydrate kinase [Ferrimonas balearica]MBY5993908.1 FGGY-family carbohydrate kinase [Ferrimonas balearica]